MRGMVLAAAAAVGMAGAAEAATVTQDLTCNLPSGSRYPVELCRSSTVLFDESDEGDTYVFNFTLTSDAGIERPLDYNVRFIRPGASKLAFSADIPSAISPGETLTFSISTTLTDITRPGRLLIIVSAVPLPASVALTGLALAGLALMRRLRPA